MFTGSCRTVDGPFSFSPEGGKGNEGVPRTPGKKMSSGMDRSGPESGVLSPSAKIQCASGHRPGPAENESFVKGWRMGLAHSDSPPGESLKVHKPKVVATWWAAVATLGTELTLAGRPAIRQSVRQ